MEKADLTGPNRCQRMTEKGQCQNAKHPGLDFCRMHGGGALIAANRTTLRNYRLRQLGERVLEKKNSSEIKGLREEVGILRLVLEEALNKLDVEDPNSLTMYSSRIQGMVDSITRTVQVCHTLEEKTNFVLDKSKVFIIADTIIQIISEYIVDPEHLATISERIASSVNNIAGEDQ